MRLDFLTCDVDIGKVQGVLPSAGSRIWYTGVLALGATLWLRAEVVLNEIHYEVSEEGVGSEFVELLNAGSEGVDLGGWFLSEAVFFELPAGTLIGPGEYLVIAEDPERVRNAWGVAALGPYQGRLSNDGDRLVLRDARGDEVDRVEYGVGFPWPTASAGTGSSMELIHPSLDNDLGGSWRASQVPVAERSRPEDPAYLVRRRAHGWEYLKGLSPPSDPPAAWRQPGFVTNGVWQVGQAGFGYGGDDDFTELTDMRRRYSSVFLRREFTIANPAALPALDLRVYTDNGCIVWLNGVEVGRFHVAPAEPEFDDLAGGAARPARWEELHWAQPADTLLLAGTNVVAVHALKASGQADSFSIDLELAVPPARGLPTPGRRNSVYAERAPPQLRQVAHQPVRPRSGEPIQVTVKATDPEGVRSVRLLYQAVPPGGFVPAFLPVPHDTLVAAPDTPLAPNPAFGDPANWLELSMRDDGRGGDVEANDGVYTAVIPAQKNRTLVRYRITAADRGERVAEVRVPYPDDRALNFAAFVYDGVPPFRPGDQTVHPEGLGHEYSAEVMTSLPVYHLLVREQDFLEAHGYDWALRLPQWQMSIGQYHPAYSVFNWEATLVYEGEVYDHVRFRLRQANARYGPQEGTRGKRSLRFRFNPGHRFQARGARGELYPVRWRTLNLGKMSDLFEVGDYGLPEWMNYHLWNLGGVPAPWAFHAQLRVIDGPEEAPPGRDGQYHGDFWGMYLAVEDYDAAFLEAHGLPDGNLYKLAAFEMDGTQLERHRARGALEGDADFQNVWRNLSVDRPEWWLRMHVNYPLWQRYFAVAEAVRHWDFAPIPQGNKNQAWFFEPSTLTPFGRLWVLPWDTDLTWGPSFTHNTGMDYPRWAMISTNGPGHVALRIESRVVLRELRDLLWRPEVINPMIDRRVAGLAELSLAERDRWRGAPQGFDDVPLEVKAQDMKNFAFVGWQGANGVALDQGGRAAYLDEVAREEGDEQRMPERPTISYAGPPGHPLDALPFEISAFRDPQGDATFGAVRWRIAEVNEDPSQPPLEWNSVWESGAEAVWSDRYLIPGARLRPGARYRVRAQVGDVEGYWSRWSEPVAFVAGRPQAPVDWSEVLRVTEIMYHAPGGSEFDYLELMNIGTAPLNLETVSLREPVRFEFAGGAVTSLAPFERVVVVGNFDCFRQRYRDSNLRVAGEYHGSLPNSAGVIVLADAWVGEFLRCPYEDDWYPATDGGGYTLELRDPAARQDSGLGKAGWQASSDYRGSPGVGQETFDRDGDGLPDAWEFRHGLRLDDPTDTSSDADGDGHSALEEYLAGTDPSDPASVLRLAHEVIGGRVRLEYRTALAGGSEETHGRRRYVLEQKTGSGEAWQPIQPSEPSSGGTVTVWQALSPAAPPRLFRVRLWFER